LQLQLVGGVGIVGGLLSGSFRWLSHVHVSHVCRSVHQRLVCRQRAVKTAGSVMLALFLASTRASGKPCCQLSDRWKFSVVAKFTLFSLFYLSLCS
jgi:hypothetical protein